MLSGFKNARKLQSRINKGLGQHAHPSLAPTRREGRKHQAVYTMLWASKGGQLADAIRTSQELVGIISELVGTSRMHFAA